MRTDWSNRTGGKIRTWVSKAFGMRIFGPSEHLAFSVFRKIVRGASPVQSETTGDSSVQSELDGGANL